LKDAMEGMLAPEMKRFLVLLKLEIFKISKVGSCRLYGNGW
jgi:hypothetical protein